MVYKYYKIYNIGNRHAFIIFFYKPNAYPCEHFQIYDRVWRQFHNFHVAGIHVHGHQQSFFKF